MKWVLLMLCFMGGTVIAEPIVIRDYGGHASGVPDKAAIARSVMSATLKPVTKMPLSACVSFRENGVQFGMQSVEVS